MKKIYVTKPSLPPLEELQPYLQAIWESHNLTNNGAFHKQFEAELAAYLNVPYISVFSNATIALLASLRALEISGEVITTPYSFIATSHSILWNGLTPVFADVDPKDLNLSPTKVEKLITSKTAAVLPVHCYGTPCDLEGFDHLAKQHQLKILYDAAHAFGVQKDGKSILDAGDASVVSFHATKVFNTFEGGAVITRNRAIKDRLDSLRNFGIQDEVTVTDLGINGKMSEFNAALGLLQLKYIDQEIVKRKKVDGRYREKLSGVKGLSLFELEPSLKSNYGYFPILIEKEYPLSRDELYNVLRTHDLFARRYFYPLISSHQMYRDLPTALPEQLPVAFMAAEKILCLPIYADLEIDVQEQVIDFIRDPKR